MHEGDHLAFLKAAADGVYVLPEGQRRLAEWIHQCQAAEYQRQQHEAAGALDHVQIDLLTPDAALNAEAAANAALGLRADLKVSGTFIIDDSR